VPLALHEHFVPDLAGRGLEILRGIFDLVDLFPVHFHDAEHGPAVGLEALERPDRGGQLRAGAVGGPVQQRGDHAAQAAGLVGVVGQSARHEQAAEVGIAQPDRPVAMAVGRDLGRGVAAVIDEDFLGDEHHPARRRKPLRVEGAVLAAELHQIHAGQVAGRVVEEHVLGAGVGGVDAAGVRAGVPAVDRAVVLDPRVAAGPGRLGDAAEQLAGLVGRTLAIRLGDPVGGPVLVGLDRLHEVVGDPHREVRVLEQDRAVRFLGVVPLGGQDPRLGLLLALALDEFEDVGMGDFEGLHFGGAAGLAAALDHGGDLVVDPHERQRPGRPPPAR